MEHKREVVKKKSSRKAIAVPFKTIEEREKAEAFFDRKGLVVGKWVRSQIIEKMEKEQ